MKHWLTVTVTSLIFLGHVLTAWSDCDWSIVQRSGAVVVAIAILFEGWTILKTPITEDMPQWSRQQTHSLARSAVVILIVGSLIQGYGDVLFRAIPCR